MSWKGEKGEVVSYKFDNYFRSVVENEEFMLWKRFMSESTKVSNKDISKTFKTQFAANVWNKSYLAAEAKLRKSKKENNHQKCQD